MGQLLILGLAFPAVVSADNSRNVKRICGNNRYETSINICNNFNSDKVQNVIVASGNNFPDALSGSALASKHQAPILLTDGNNIAPQKDYLNTTKYANIIILGGTGAISDNVKLEVNSDADIEVLHFDENGHPYHSEIKTDDMIDYNYEDRPVFTLSIKDNKVIVMDQQYRS